MASPSPKRVRPTIKKATDFKGGVTVNAFGELQNNVGTLLIDRKRKFNFITTLLCLSTALPKTADILWCTALWTNSYQNRSGFLAKLSLTIKAWAIVVQDAFSF